MRSGRPHSRFAVSVNRKIGGAVQRNYIKRKMKEWFRLNKSLIEQPHDLWISVKKPFGREHAARVERLFLDALVRIRYR
ncbi:MAG: ribonuclease P protein component [Candidatus Aminicenantes bacterium]|nr:ribonuclease P protein component [Candidatus Aminicenantes bacterium]